MQENTLAKAEAIAEKIRISISSGELKDKASGKSYGKLTISIGIAQFRMNDKANDFIQRADKALYLAKERGRDRIERIVKSAAGLDMDATTFFSRLWDEYIKVTPQAEAIQKPITHHQEHEGHEGHEGHEDNKLINNDFSSCALCASW